MMTTLIEEGTTAEGAGRTEVLPRPYHWTVDAYHRAWDAGVFGHDLQLELVFGRVIERFAEGGPTDYHWTVDAFDRACEAGVFPETCRLELIHGRVIDRMGQGPLHFALTAYIAKCLRAVFSSHYMVRQEGPLPIAFDGEPVPDVSVVHGSELDYLERHPTPEDSVLLVEIAVSSEQNDLGAKALLYAQAGIMDYWVVMPGERAVIVHREPTVEGYALVTRLGEDDAVSPLAASDVRLSVRSLLGL